MHQHRIFTDPVICYNLNIGVLPLGGVARKIGKVFDALPPFRARPTEKAIYKPVDHGGFQKELNFV